MINGVRVEADALIAVASSLEGQQRTLLDPGGTLVAPDAGASSEDLAGVITIVVAGLHGLADGVGAGADAIRQAIAAFSCWDTRIGENTPLRVRRVGLPPVPAGR